MSVSSTNLQSVLNQLQSAAGQAAGQNKEPAEATSGDSFAHALMSSIDRIDALKQSAIAEGHDFEIGKPGVALNDVMVGMAKADVGMQMGIQVRNRVVNAYKDIMNMQV